MSLSVTQILLLSVICGLIKTRISYSIGTFVRNTVIMNAVIVGLITGRMVESMILGASLQMIYMGLSAAGGNMSSDSCIATYIVIPLALTMDIDLVAASALAVPVGLLAVHLTNLSFVIYGFFANKADKCAEKGDTKGVTFWGIFVCFVVGFVFFTSAVALTLFAGSVVTEQLVNAIPPFLNDGLVAVGHALPAEGFAVIASFFGKPILIPFFFAGFFFSQYSGMGNVPMLLISLFIAFMFYLFKYHGQEGNSLQMEAHTAQLEQRLLSKKDIRNSYLRWITFCEVPHSYERMQAPGLTYAMIPILKKLYPGEENKPKLIDGLKRHMVFYNTQGHIGGGTILGVVLALEEKKSLAYDQIDDQSIIDVKTSLMGPLAGIGDTLISQTLRMILIGIFLPMATQGSPWGGILPFVFYTVIAFAAGYFLCVKCYNAGAHYIQSMLVNGVFNKIIMVASVVGLFMMGAMSASYVQVTTPLVIATEYINLAVQDRLDAILPGILPLLFVCGGWLYLTKVKRDYLRLALGITVISFVLGCLGILA